MDHDIPHAETTRYERKIFFILNFKIFVMIIIGMLKYYQWSPFILLFMALCFYFPRMIWRSLNNKSGLDIEKLVKEALKQEQAGQAEERQKAIEYIINSIRVYIENRYTYPTQDHSRSKKFPKKFWYSLTFWRHRHLSSFIVLLFTFVKLLFLINSLVQIFLLNSFLGNDYHLFGFEVIHKFVRGLDWGESKRFPRVTLCDFHIREIGIVHRYTVQCVLPINLFNEKIFLILWFWILLLATFNIGDFIAWLLRIIQVDRRSAYVRRKLEMYRASKETSDDSTSSKEMKLKEKERRKKFVRDYLQEDGCFALRLLARNGQDIIVGEVINKLYEDFRIKDDRSHLNTDHPIRLHNSNNYPISPPSIRPRSQQFETLNNDEDHRNLISQTTS
jgi:hypothetical protein